MSACKNCGSTQVDEDGAHGYTICMGCGNVLEDQIIVSETQFSEGMSGRKHIMGSLVMEDGSVIGGGGLPSRFGAHKNYQRRIVEEATRVMFSIANRLKLTQQHIDSAVMFYKMALSKRILQGKRKCHVCAACLYIVCRTERTPHILLDFSEIIHENMFQLVRVYTKLCNALCIKLPAADPCLFISRYAQRLQLGDKSDVIAVTAMRLVSRMKRDWMATGRRPSSLCGAALVVSCRLHGRSRQISDIAKIVRNATATISKRLKEFSQTPSSKLSIEEFENVDLGEEEDPPAFKALKQKNRAKEVEMTLLEQELVQYKQKLEEEMNETEGDEERDTSTLYKKPDYDPNQTTAAYNGSLALKTAYGAIPNYVGGENAASDPVKSSDTSAVKSSDTPADKQKCVKKEVLIKQECDGFSDVDDEEIGYLILTPREIAIKKKRWNETDHDEFLAERAKKKAERELEERTKPKRKYKRSQKFIHLNKGMISKTPAEAMEKMIKEKKLSTKINYDVLKNLGSQSDAAIARLRCDTDTEVGVKRQRLDTDTSVDEEIHRTRYDTTDSVLSQDEEEVIKGGFVANEEDYLNYSEGLVINDAIQTFNDGDEYD